MFFFIIYKMADITTQLQNIKFQLKNIDMAFENMIMLFQNMNLNNPEAQIKSMGIQMLSIGIQMMNIGIQMPNINNDLNILQQIQNISSQIKNIEMQISNPIQNSMVIGMNNNMMMNNRGIGMNQMNNIGKEVVIRRENQVKIDDNILKNINKITVEFKTTGKSYGIIVDYGTTVQELIKKFYEVIKKPEKKGKYYFVFNAQIINNNDDTKVEYFFGRKLHAHITALDNGVIIGG